MKNKKDKPGDKAMRLYNESSEAFSRWVDYTFDIVRQEGGKHVPEKTKMKNEDDVRKALQRVLSHFQGNWPRIVVTDTNGEGGFVWMAGYVDDETRDDILYARKLVE